MEFCKVCRPASRSLVQQWSDNFCIPQPWDCQHVHHAGVMTQSLMGLGGWFLKTNCLVSSIQQRRHSALKKPQVSRNRWNDIPRTLDDWYMAFIDISVGSPSTVEDSRSLVRELKLPFYNSYWPKLGRVPNLYYFLHIVHSPWMVSYNLPIWSLACDWGAVWRAFEWLALGAHSIILCSRLLHRSSSLEERLIRYWAPYLAKVNGPTLDHTLIIFIRDFVFSFIRA